MQWWASLSNLMSRWHCVFQGSGLQVTEMQPAIRLHGSTAVLPRQPACPVVMLCKVPLWRRAWSNLLRSSAWVHWFKHILVASEFPVELQGSPQHPATSQGLLLPGTLRSSLNQTATGTQDRHKGRVVHRGRQCYLLLVIPEKCFHDLDQLEGVWFGLQKR